MRWQKKQGAASATFHARTGDDELHFTFRVGKETIVYHDLNKSSIFVLRVLGFIVAEGEMHGVLVIMPQAFEWAKYRQKKRFGKALYRGWRTWKNNAGPLAAAVAIFIATVLATLQIAQILHLFK